MEGSRNRRRQFQPWGVRSTCRTHWRVRSASPREQNSEERKQVEPLTEKWDRICKALSM